ncbi:MAG: hypothetical protein CMJ20_05445 [Phycisphaeraceae bacterium]|nr:hypothetical protein [Phycisphaeraceae bacterium]
MNILHANRTPIGLDLGDWFIKAIQLSRAQGKWQIAAASIIPRLRPGEPIDLAEIERLTDILDRQGFRGRRIVTAPSGTQVACEALELPPRESGAPIEQIARMEIARLQRLEPESFEIALWDIPGSTRSSSSSTVMATSYAHEKSDALINLLESCGWVVFAIDLKAWAYARCAAHGALPQPVAVVDCGAHATSFVLLDQGNVTYERTLSEISFASLTDLICKQFKTNQLTAEYLVRQMSEPICQVDMDRQKDDQWSELRAMVQEFEEKLSAQLQVSLDYVSRRYARLNLCHIRLVGGGALVEDLDLRLGKQLGLTVKKLTPSELFKYQPWIGQACQSPILTASLGLALYEL